MGVAAVAAYIGVGMVQRWIAVGTLLGLFGAPTTSYATTSGEETVNGSWLNAVPCVVTNYSNETGRFTCTGSSVWLGAWDGVTAFEFKAVMDRSTGNVHGTITETFAGSSTAEHAVGTLSFTEVLDFDGRTGAVQIEADITGGAGDPPFRCSSGHVSYDGWAAPVAMGFGGWRGTWKHGCPAELGGGSQLGRPIEPGRTQTTAARPDRLPPPQDARGQ